MIKAKRYLTTVLIFILCLSLGSCGFAQYIPYGEANVSDENLDASLSEMLNTINTLYLLDICHESRLDEFKAALLDAKNELQECATVEELEKIFENHLNEIMLIAVSSYINIADYRDSEQSEIEDIARYYAKEIVKLSDRGAMDALFRQLEVEIYSIKTAEEYYADELYALKKQLKRDLTTTPEYPKYSLSEFETIEALVSLYESKINNAETKEDVNLLFDSYKEALTQIPTISQTNLTKKKEAETLWRRLLSAFSERHSLCLEDEITELLSRMSATDSPMLICRMGSEFIIDASSDIGSGALEDIADIAYLYLESAVSPNDYRKEQLDLIVDIIEAAEFELKNATDISAAKEILLGAKNSILSIPTSDELWEEEDAEFFETLQATYGDSILAVPEKMNEASTYEELAAIIDYYAFYQTTSTSFLRDTFRVKLLYSYKTPTWEKNMVYWYCELIRSAVGITGHYERTTSGDYYVITLIPYAISTNTNATDGPVEVDRYESLVDFKPSSNGQTSRGEDFNDFAYLKENTKKLSGVWNTQQLWYALQYGYLPEVISGSPADKTLERAKDILRQSIYEGMTDEEKVYAIFNWFSENVIFDDDYTKYLYPENRDEFPDELAATLNSFHAEGALFDNLAVCEGFAKAMLIMLRIEGIESYRLFIHGYTDNAINNLGYDGYGSHALIAIKMYDGKFYISDPYEAYQHNTRYPKLHQFLIPWELHTTFVGSWSEIFTDIEYGKTILTSVMDNLTYNGKSIFVKTESELLAILRDFKNETASDVCISVFDYSERTVEDLMVAEKLTELGINYHKISYDGLDEYILYKD